MNNIRSSEAGFTLIETLVALVILAMSAISLLGATEAHINRIAALENRASAQWVLENHLAELTLGLTPAQTPEAMNGAAYTVAENLVATQDPDLAQVDLTARGATDGRDYNRLTGFLDTTAKGLAAP